MSVRHQEKRGRRRRRQNPCVTGNNILELIGRRRETSGQTNWDALVYIVAASCRVFPIVCLCIFVYISGQSFQCHWNLIQYTFSLSLARSLSISLPFSIVVISNIVVHELLSEQQNDIHDKHKMIIYGSIVFSSESTTWLLLVRWEEPMGLDFEAKMLISLHLTSLHLTRR